MLLIAIDLLLFAFDLMGLFVDSALIMIVLAIVFIGFNFAFDLLLFAFDLLLICYCLLLFAFDLLLKKSVSGLFRKMRRTPSPAGIAVTTTTRFGRRSQKRRRETHGRGQGGRSCLFI